MPTTSTDINTGSTVVTEVPVTVDPVDNSASDNPVVSSDAASDTDINTDNTITSSTDVNESETVTKPVTANAGGGGGGGGWSDGEVNVTTETPKKFFEKSINLMGVGLTVKDILISLALGAVGFWAAKRTNQQPTGLIGYTTAGMLAGITLSKLIIKKK